MTGPITDLAAFAAYAASMSITPGPNNSMVATLGARHGFRAAVPAIGGIMAGVFGLLVASGAGIAAALMAHPQLKLALALGGCSYLAYLAYVLWTADGAKGGKERGPVGFWGAAVLQAVNPKALMMAVTAEGTFLAPTAGLTGAVTLAGLFVAIGAPCVGLWAVAGDRLQSWLSKPGRMVLFSRTMAALLAATAVGILVETFHT